VKAVKESDDRLTDEICQEYVEAISQIDVGASADFRRESETCAIVYLLERIGIVEVSEAKSDVAEVEELKSQIAVLNMRLSAKLNEMAHKAIFRVT
jgi:Xaa-Pro aminopeptidase